MRYHRAFTFFPGMSVAEPEPPFLAGAGAEKITQFRLRLRYRGRRSKIKIVIFFNFQSLLFNLNPQCPVDLKVEYVNFVILYQGRNQENRFF